MSLNKHQLSDSLFIWLQSFQVPSCASKHELTSGVAIAHVLNKIDSTWFNETWLSRIKEDGGTNWRLKVSNLKKILQSMMEYYHDVLSQQVSDEHVPDVRLLEERNHVYMQRTCELEEEQRRATAIRSQLDSYKRQAHEMSAKHSAEAMKAEKWQFEYKNLNDKYETLLKEREKLISERDTLRETTEELRCAQVQQQCLTDSMIGDAGAVGSLASEIMPTEFRDTVVRLQQENKMLCVQEESYRHRLEELQTQLEEAQRRQNTLETQNRLSQQQISDLSAQVEELQRALQEQDSRNEDVISSLLKKKLEEHLEKLHEAHSDLQKKREVIDDLEPPLDINMAKKVDELQEILKKKDEDMRRMEDRYKRYVEKARTVIKTLEPKQKLNPVPVEVQALKNQLSEKDRKIQHLEHDFEKTRSRHDQEEKLIISAWYNMGMALHQRVAGERSSSSSSSAQSFLAQQRQSTQARRGFSRLQPR
uniref:Zgc:66419 n=1 Tax=Danio rerio TaxID=7955 RepID=Q7SXD7_DANRE|nr:Zgc:66419 [Danio rerio]|eukprot:NP_957405.1 hook microtubule-tethering protein 2 [Danio rerio]